jgi:hypothetical protein
LHDSARIWKERFEHAGPARRQKRFQTLFQFPNSPGKRSPREVMQLQNLAVIASRLAVSSFSIGRLALTGHASI